MARTTSTGTSTARPLAWTPRVAPARHVDGGLELWRTGEYEALAVRIREQAVRAIVTQNVAIPSRERRALFEALEHLVRRRPAVAPLRGWMRLPVQPRRVRSGRGILLGGGDHRINEQQTCEALRLRGRRFGHGMAAHGVSDTDDVGEVKPAHQLSQIAAEVLPVYRERLVAAAVPPLIDSNDAARVEVGHDAIPAAGVKTGGVCQQDGTVRTLVALPLEYGKGDSIDRQAAVDRLHGHEHREAPRTRNRRGLPLPGAFTARDYVGCPRSLTSCVRKLICSRCRDRSSVHCCSSMVSIF